MNAYTGDGAVMVELLVEYKYFNMDDAMANALKISLTLFKQHGKPI